MDLSESLEPNPKRIRHDFNTIQIEKKNQPEKESEIPSIE